ncbi:rod shape-determining protein MreC [Candidatus Uhrbacteria bacterium]|nr:rod shape-determining protein MreC [Candidatus Uhrbacteria bacterium]
MHQRIHRAVIISIVSICALWIAHGIGILAPVEARSGYVLSRLSFMATRVSDFFQNISDLFTQKEKTPLHILEERIQKLEVERAALTIAQSENETLREQLKFVQQSKFHVQLANRIGWTTDVRRSGFLIDKGKNDGITLSAPVLTNNGVLVGKINKVMEATSQVLLINDSKSKVTAIIAATPPTTGVVNGQFGLGLKIDLIPMSEKIEIGDIVETSGLQDGIPAGLLIGTISKFDTRPTDLFQTASVSPAVDYARVRIVSVLVQ